MWREAPHPTASECAKYAMKPREQLMTQVPKQAKRQSRRPALFEAACKTKSSPRNSSAKNPTLISLLNQEGSGWVKLNKQNPGNQTPNRTPPNHLTVNVK